MIVVRRFTTACVCSRLSVPLKGPVALIVLRNCSIRILLLNLRRELVDAFIVARDSLLHVVEVSRNRLNVVLCQLLVGLSGFWHISVAWYVDSFYVSWVSALSPNYRAWTDENLLLLLWRIIGIDPSYLVRFDHEISNTTSNRFPFFIISHAHTHHPFTLFLTNHDHLRLRNRTIGSLMTVRIIDLIGCRIYIVVKGGLFLCQDHIVIMYPVLFMHLMVELCLHHCVFKL